MGSDLKSYMKRIGRNYQRFGLWRWHRGWSDPEQHKRFGSLPLPDYSADQWRPLAVNLIRVWVKDKLRKKQHQGDFRTRRSPPFRKSGVCYFLAVRDPRIFVFAIRVLCLQIMPPNYLNGVAAACQTSRPMQGPVHVQEPFGKILSADDRDYYRNLTWLILPFIEMESTEETPLLASAKNLDHEQVYNRFSPARKRGILTIVSLIGLIPRTHI